MPIQNLQKHQYFQGFLAQLLLSIPAHRAAFAQRQLA
jgi:hypothetical protein